MSKMLGRSKSEDSVCNSAHNATPVHEQVRVTYAQSSTQRTYAYHGAEPPAVAPVPPASTSGHSHVGMGAHFFHTTSGAYECLELVTVCKPTRVPSRSDCYRSSEAQTQKVLFE